MKQLWKRLISCCLLLCLLAALSAYSLPQASAATYSGRCGSSATWKLDTATGVLTIGGSGAMYDYSHSWSTTENTPWSSYADSITSVVIGDSITSIGEEAFGSPWNLGVLPNLKQVTIGSGVTSIGRYAFMGSALTSVTIPAAVNTLYGSAFRFCDQLREINVSAANRSYASVDGVLYNKAQTELLCYPGGKTTAVFTLPHTVKTIAVEAFTCNEHITVVNLPEGLTSIGSMAFESCTSLKRIKLPSTLRKLSLDAFTNCSRLDLVVPDTVTSIDMEYFYDGGFYQSHIYFLGKAPSVSSFALEGLYGAIIHYNPEFAGWTELMNRVENFDYDLEITWEEWDGETIADTDVPVYTDSYYTPTENRLFRISGRGSEYGSYPKGFTVSLKQEQFQSGMTDGRSYTDDINVQFPRYYYGNVTITHNDYHPFTIPYYYTDQYNTISMVPKTVTEPFAQILLMKKDVDSQYYDDLLTNSIHFTEVGIQSIEEKLYLYPSVNWNGHEAGLIWLQQGDLTVELQNNTLNALNWVSMHFVAGEPVYLCGQSADGTAFQTKTGMNIYENNSDGISIDFGETLTVDTAGSSEEAVAIFSDEKIALDFSKLSDGAIPVKFTVQADGTVKGTFGLTLADDSYSEAAFTSLRELSTTLKNWPEAEQGKQIAETLKSLKKFGVIPASNVSLGISGKVQFLGCFTGKFENGSFHFTDCNGICLMEGSFSGTYSTLILSNPAYFKLALATKLEEFFYMESAGEPGKLMLAGRQPLHITVSISAEAAAGWEGFLSGGVKGTGSLKIKTESPIRKEVTSLGLKGELAFVGTLAGVKGTWVFWESPDMIFWEAGSFCWKEAGDDGNGMVFIPDLNRSVMLLSEDTSGSIVTGVCGYTAPAVAVLDDGRILAVWVADVPQRSNVDKNGIYYSIRDLDGNWSAPALVHDDGTNDALPQLHQTGSTVTLSWQNYSTVFDTDVLPDYDTVTGQLAIVTATFHPQTGSWSTPSQSEPDWYLAPPELPADYEGSWPVSDTVRQVLQEQGHRAVLYTAADEAGTTQVFGLFHDGHGWGFPVQLTHSSSPVQNFHAAVSNGIISLLFTCGELSNSALFLEEISLAGDLAITGTDYIRSTFSMENNGTLYANAANHGCSTIEGVIIRVMDGETELAREIYMAPLLPGEERRLYVNCYLYDSLNYDGITLELIPLSEDADPDNNAAPCQFYTEDISVEQVSATLMQGGTLILTQIVNRGSTATAATELSYHKDAPDGELLATSEVPALAPGESVSISVTVSDLSDGDLVYVEAAGLEQENLFGNNTSLAAVREQTSDRLALSTSCSFSGNMLQLSVHADNRTLSSIQGVTLIAVAYDAATGRQVAVDLLALDNLPALNAQRCTFELYTGAAQNIIWKVFILDSGYLPLFTPLSGEI